MKKFVSLAVAALALIAAGCRPVLPPKAEGSVSPDEISVSYNGGEVEFTIVANYAWSVTENPDNLVVVPSEGSATSGTPVKVTLPENASSENVEHTIGITVGGDENAAEVTVKFIVFERPPVI